MLIFYHLVIFSEFVIDVETKFIMGYSLLICLGILIALNIGISIKKQISSALRQKRMKKAKADMIAMDRKKNPQNYRDLVERI